MRACRGRRRWRILTLTRLRIFRRRRFANWQKRRVRFTTAANLVNELVEAQQHNGVRRVLARWMRYDVIALDEVGYVPLAEIGAEFLFQVIADRAERAT